jgi:hypothetical protein
MDLLSHVENKTGITFTHSQKPKIEATGEKQYTASIAVTQFTKDLLDDFRGNEDYDDFINKLLRK